DQHWAASATGDLEREHDIYDDHVVTDDCNDCKDTTLYTGKRRIVKHSCVRINRMVRSIDDVNFIVETS
ncbi:MAG TPA: hypothetical protein VE076_03330, partial [Nitrososphaeraceae archaeon]|nr:hypothetical protein [Nitrososphaeraceae archaeon]